MTLKEKLNLLISKLEEKFGKQKVEILLKHTDDLNNNLRTKFFQQILDGNIDIDNNQYWSKGISDELFKEIESNLLNLTSNEKNTFLN